MSDTLYSWGNPLSFAKFLDHTWVTDYPMVPKQPDDSAYWYCWGIQHDTYRAELSKGTGSCALANKISPYNTPALQSGESHDQPSKTSGAIVYYGLDGVCHNVDNELLAVTATSDTEPDRVSQAHGYPLSTFLFGTYGLYTEGWAKLVNKHLKGLKLAGDDFIGIMEAAVSADKQSGVLAIRAEVQSDIRDIRARVKEKQFDYYFELGERVVIALGKLRIHLGHDEFYALFPSLSRESLDHENADWLRPPL